MGRNGGCTTMRSTESGAGFGTERRAARLGERQKTPDVRVTHVEAEQRETQPIQRDGRRDERLCGYRGVHHATGRVEKQWLRKPGGRRRGAAHAAAPRRRGGHAFGEGRRHRASPRLGGGGGAGSSSVPNAAIARAGVGVSMLGASVLPSGGGGVAGDAVSASAPGGRWPGAASSPRPRADRRRPNARRRPCREPRAPRETPRRDATRRVSRGRARRRRRCPRPRTNPRPRRTRPRAHAGVHVRGRPRRRPWGRGYGEAPRSSPPRQPTPARPPSPGRRERRGNVGDRIERLALVPRHSASAHRPLVNRRPGFAPRRGWGSPPRAARPVPPRVHHQTFFVHGQLPVRPHAHRPVAHRRLERARRGRGLECRCRKMPRVGCVPAPARVSATPSRAASPSGRSAR